VAPAPAQPCWFAPALQLLRGRYHLPPPPDLGRWQAPGAPQDVQRCGHPVHRSAARRNRSHRSVRRALSDSVRASSADVVPGDWLVCGARKPDVAPQAAPSASRPSHRQYRQLPVARKAPLLAPPGGTHTSSTTHKGCQCTSPCWPQLRALASPDGYMSESMIRRCREQGAIATKGAVQRASRGLFYFEPHTVP